MAKLADFGLASDSHGMTMEGALVGTPYYMPPEACVGEANRSRRRPLFPGGHLVSFPERKARVRASKHHDVAARPRRGRARAFGKLAPEVPEAITKLVHHCLAKDPDQRPASAQALVDAHCRHWSPRVIRIPRSVPDVMAGVAGVDPSDSQALSTGQTALAYPDDDSQVSKPRLSAYPEYRHR